MLRVVLVLFVLCVVATALVPTILSTAPFRNSLLSEANRVLGGSVELEDLSLTLTGLSMAGLVLWPGDRGVGEPLLEIPRMESDKDILPLFLGRIAVRSRVEGFRARLEVDENGRTNLEDFLGVPVRDRRMLRAVTDGQLTLPRRRDGPPRRAVRDVRALWPDIACDISLADGSALLVDRRLGTTSGVEDLDISLKSARYADPLELRLCASVRVDETRSPFELVARAFGDMEPRWELELRAERLAPGSLTAPLLAAVCPLLAGNVDGTPVVVRAPLDLALDLSGTDVDVVLESRGAEGLSGRLDVRLGAGDVEGGVFGRAQALLDALAERGVELGETPPRLALHGFVGTLIVSGEHLRIERASLLDATGAEHPLEVEGSADLDGLLHYRIPWTALVRGERAERLLQGRMLTIEGPWEAPRVESGLEDLLSGDGPMDASSDGDGAGREEDVGREHVELGEVLRERLEGDAPRR
ncbi:MAG: AsmA family protein [Planctomycetota bacterium]